MILEIFRDSFGYTFKDMSILKLGLLSIFSFLLIPIFILCGYSYRIILIGIHGMINKNDKKPQFDKIGQMLVQGLKIAIISLIYNLPGIIATYLLISQGYIFQIVKTANMSRLNFNIEYLALLAVICFICLLFTSVAIPNMVNNNGSLKWGFKIKEILSIIKSVGILNYIKFSLGGLIIFIGISIFVLLAVQLLVSIFANIGIILTGNIVIGIYSFIGLFFIVPIFILFESRAIAMIYNSGIIIE